MNEATIIGVDLAKNVIPLHGAAAEGSVFVRRKLSRLHFHRFMSDHQHRFSQCRPAAAATIGHARWSDSATKFG